MTDDLGALLDLAVDAVVAAARRNTGVVLSSSVTFVPITRAELEANGRAAVEACEAK